MPQLQLSENGTAAPPVVIRTSTPGARRWKSASRGISQRMAKVGPTPTVSGSGPAWRATSSVSRAMAASSGASPSR
jgi:hypothetical protein